MGVERKAGPKMAKVSIPMIPLGRRQCPEQHNKRGVMGSGENPNKETQADKT